MSGYYAIPVTASVHFVDSVTGADAGTYSNTDYVGDSMDNPAYDPTQDYSGTTSPNSAALPVTGNWPKSTASMSPYGAIVPPPPVPLPARRVASGILAGLPNPIKLGLYSKYHYTEKYKVAVQPKFKVGDVSFAIPSGVASLTATPEMATSAKGQQVQTGNVILVLTAKLPSRNPVGELMVATRVSTNKAIGSANVLVLQPDTLGSTPPFDEDVKGVNFLEGNYTSPADASLTGKTVALVTEFEHFANMQVYDQFTKPLDAIFSGTEVEEMYDATAGKTGSPYASINSPISASGNYLDPIGFIMPGNGTQSDATTTASQNWINNIGPNNQPSLPLGAVDDVTQTFHIYVGSHELSNSKYTRNYKISYPTRRQIGVMNISNMH